MKVRKKLLSVLTAACIAFSSFNIGSIFADSSKVVTIGVNNSTAQRQAILNYFGVNENEVEIITVNNQEERAYLGGIATEEQLGRKTYSCAYVEPTREGSGINVKTQNITWVTKEMVETCLSTAGVTGANCIIAAVFPVSGTGALTGVMKAFESATGEKLDEEKKELASEELITTGDLGDEIGQDKATGIINDVKTEVIKNNTKDVVQIADTINNIANNYNITLTDSQVDKIVALMEKIAAQNYNYNDMKATLEGVSDSVVVNLREAGETLKNSGILDSIAAWFSSIFSKDNSEAGILSETNDSAIGENGVLQAAGEVAGDVANTVKENMPTREETEGFIQQLMNWLSSLFS